jgi:large subunit ribosomal protein L10
MAKGYTKQSTKKSGRGRKEQIVAELVEKLDASKGLVLADYQGLTHKQLEDLKRDLKKLDSTILVTKNTLFKLSLEKSQNYSAHKDSDALNLPTAALFINGDTAETLKRLQKAIKEFGLPKIKFGVLEGQAVDEAGVLKIASLPSREVLLGQLVGTLNSPISGLVMTLNANIQKFVMTLAAVRDNKPQTASPTEPTDQAEVPQAEAEPTQVEKEPAVHAAPPAVQPDAPQESLETPEIGPDNSEGGDK